MHLVSCPRPQYARTQRGSSNIVYNELFQTLECGATNQIAWFVNSITSVRYVQEFSHFSRDYETLITLYVVTLTIIEFHWNNSMYTMLPDPIPEK